MDLEALRAAGLYDPDAPDAAARAELLRYLVDQGATIEELRTSDADGNLSSLGFDRRLRNGDASAADLAARTGTDLSVVLETYRLLGIPITDPHRSELSSAEGRLFELLALAGSTLPEGMTEEILVSIGAALTLVSESTVSAFVGSVEGLLEQGSPRARAEFTSATGELGLELGALLEPLLRHHLWAAVNRQRAAMRTSSDRLESTVAIGFVDLVGFTTTTSQMGSTQLLDFMQRFQRRAFDVVTAAGGRLVKHIGDEIMFASPEPGHGCEIALALIEAFSDAESLPRGGLAHGLVVARHGDYYGPVVNLAARLADIAVSGEVLADAAVAEAVGPGRYSFEPAGRRQLKGFPDPVRVVSLGRDPT